jgi:hypothetical protein
MRIKDMRQGRLMMTIGFTIALGLMVRAAEKPSPEYVKAMKDLSGVVQALTKPGASEDFELAKKNATTAKDAFDLVKTFWAGKGATDAVKLADAGSKAVADLSVSANLSSKEGVEAALKDMRATCATCHTAHRDKAADGSFEIK